MADKKAPAAPRSTRPRKAVVALPTPTLPGWVPAIVYLLVTVVLFREHVFGRNALLGMDSLTLSYFARNFYTEFVQAFHRMPYWNPLLMGGLPFVEGMHGDIFYPPSLAMFFLDAQSMWGLKMALHVFLAGVFTYLWLRRGLRLDPLPAFFGGLVYMMGADLVSLLLPGGDGKLFVSALAPLVFWLAERAVSGRRLADFALFALGIALILFTSHMQAAYYCVWGVSLYFLFRVWQVWREERVGAAALRLVGLYAVAGVLGVAAAAVQFLPPLEYLREHSHRVDRAEERGYDWSSSWSLHAEEIMALAVPEFVGEVTAGAERRAPHGYWGKNESKMNHEYAGLVPLLLIPLLLIGKGSARARFFIGLAVVTLLYALASSTPFGRLFYLIPGVELFRAWSIIIFLYGLSVATLGALGVQRLQDWLTSGSAEEQAAVSRRLFFTLALVGGLALLVVSGVFTSLWTAIFYPRMMDATEAVLAANREFISQGFWIAFALTMAVTIAWQLASRGLLSARMFVLALALLAALDLYRVDRPFITLTAALNEESRFDTTFEPDDVIQALQQLRDAGAVFRVMDLGPSVGVRSSYGHNDLAVHGLEQIAGHHGNEMGRYRNLIGGERLTNMTQDLRVADITNTEYMLLPGRMDHPSLEELGAGQSVVVYRNRNALPRAYLVGATEVVPADRAIERLLSPEFDVRNIALLEEPLPQGIAVQAGATGPVEWVSRGVDRHTLRVAPDGPALLMVLDNWFPAWKATVNGREVPVLRANHTFRAIPVEAGEQTVELRYEPAQLRTGALISMVVLGLLLGVVLHGAWLARRSRAVATTA
ncbi:MAG TPA: YfhO family protein [Longimicrobiales bacterium]|nr:YfhO family protein [Longimicrobiales bacterium]